MIDWTYLVAPLAGVVLAYTFYHLLQSGLFDCVIVSVTNRAPIVGQSITVYYKHHVGAYKGVAKLYKECTDLVPKRTTTIGLYYDDPTVVEESLLNSIVGVVFTNDLSENYAEQLRRWGYKRVQLPAINRVVLCTQRFTGTISLIKMIKYTYGVMSRFVQKERLAADVKPAIEVYVHEADGMKVHIMFPLDHNEELVVPEVKQARNAKEQ